MGIEIHGMAPLIEVFDMPRSVAFYRDRLGFEVVESSPARGPDDFDWARLRKEGVELMLNTAFEPDHRPPEPEASRVTAHGDTTLFFGCPDVQAAYAHLRADGLEVEAPSLAPYGMKQLHLRDPDGYGICFQWPVG